MSAPVPYQIVVFAADPHRLARFWAGALGFELEDNSALIARILAAGQATEDDTIEIDGRRYWREAVAIRHPDDLGEGAIRGTFGRRILFEFRPADKADENRFHIDLNVGHERIAEETDRVLALGATLLEERRDAPRAVFNRMADPEGNEFCIQ